MNRRSQNKSAKQVAKEVARATKGLKHELEYHDVKILKALSSGDRIDMDELKDRVGVGRESKYNKDWNDRRHELHDRGLIRIEADAGGEALGSGKARHYNSITTKGQSALAEAEKKAGREVELVDARDVARLRAEDADEPGDQPHYEPGDGDSRQIVNRQIRRRRGQSEFRDCLLSRYQSRCVVTSCQLVDILEAAHIKPYRGAPDNHVENGLLLRADIHTLFDLNQLGIEPETLRVCLSEQVKQDPEYRSLERKLNIEKSVLPSRDALRIRYKEFLVARQYDSP